MDTIKLMVRGRCRVLLGVVPDFPVATSLADLPEVQKRLGLSDEVFMYMLNNGVRMAFMNKLRSEHQR